jgi:hypothetical protein
LKGGGLNWAKNRAKFAKKHHIPNTKLNPKSKIRIKQFKKLKICLWIGIRRRNKANMN